jgi:hypothetical protein
VVDVLQDLVVLVFVDLGALVHVTEWITNAPAPHIQQDITIYIHNKYVISWSSHSASVLDSIEAASAARLKLRKSADAHADSMQMMCIRVSTAAVPVDVIKMPTL